MPDRTFTGAKGVEKLDDLANTYYNLTVNKKLNVAYIGGSVTNGTGGKDGYCWRTDVTDWFKAKFPSATITDTNAGIGSSSSYYGYYRLDEYVLAKNPDLVFVEFAINDTYNSMTETESATYMEGIIRKIRSANANADIIIVLTGDKRYLISDFSLAKVHAKKAVAGSVYEFTFEGIGIGLLAKATDGPAANVTITLDGKEVEYANSKRSSFTHEFLTFDNLTPKEHTVKIEVTKGTLAIGGILIAE